MLPGSLALIAVITLGVGFQNPTAEDDSAALKRAIETYLNREFSQSSRNMEVRILRSSVRTDEIGSLSPRLNARNGTPRAHTRFELQDASGGDAGWTLAYVAHYDSIVIPLRNVSRDERLNSDDVDMIWMETTSLRRQPLNAETFRAAAASNRNLLSRPARRGRPLYADDLGAPATVAAGDPVEMIHDARGTEIRLRCTTREPGATNSLIRVLCSDTGRIYRARVRDTTTVLWVETL